MKNSYKGKVIIPADAHPWPHEVRVAKILALAGHSVEFIPEGNLHSPDIYLDNVRYEIKSPEKFNTNTLEHKLKDATKHSPTLIIDTSRIRKIHDAKVMNFLVSIARRQKQIKRMIMVTKHGQIIDISALI